MLWLVAAAHAEPDRAVTSVGARALYSNALGETEADLLVGERIDWGLGGDWRFGFDGRATLGLLDDPLLQWISLSELAVARRSGGVALTIGRSPVTYGGPRLVDGVQVLAGEEWQGGAWAGLAPDLFTTLPALRFGGGPIVGWIREQTQHPTTRGSSTRRSARSTHRSTAAWRGRGGTPTATPRASCGRIRSGSPSSPGSTRRGWRTGTSSIRPRVASFA